MNNNTTKNVKEEIEESLSLTELWNLVVSRWYFVLISVILCLGVATLYILTTPPVYKRTAAILIKKDNKGKSLTKDINSSFSELGFLQMNTNINNELVSIKSPTLIEEVVNRLGIQTTYEQPTSFYNKKLLYGKNLPIQLRFLDVLDDSMVYCRMSWDRRKVILSDFRKNGKEIEEKVVELIANGKPVETPVGRVLAIRTTQHRTTPLSEVEVTRHTMYKAISALEKSINVTQEDEKSTILNLSILDRSKQRAEDILSTLIDVYNESWLLERNESAVNVSSFIEKRLGIIEQDLGKVDKNITAYQTENLVPNVEAASAVFLNQASEVNSKIVALKGRAQMAKQIRNLLKEADKSSLLPVNSFINNPALEKQIAEFNELLLKRNNLIKNSGEVNPLVEDLNHSLESLRRVIIASLDNQLLSVETELNNLYASERQNTQRIAESPQQANYIMSEGRQQKVKEALYLFLLQKKEENELSKAFSVSNTRTIASPQGSALPESPNKGNIYLAAFAIGLILPIGLIYAYEVLDNKVRSKEDVANMGIPLLGEIPQLRKTTPLIGRFIKDNIQSMIVVEPNTNNLINEAFRITRTNLEFLAHKGEKRVIMATSLVPSSGKSFSVVNLAKSLTLKGAKVLIIDLDIRKAAISRIANKPRRGITDYLGEIIDEYQSIIYSDTIHKGLDMIPVGSLPPNPTELLDSDRLTKMVQELREVYDYIFLDCPPVGIVADADIIAHVADITLFVIRSGTIELKDLSIVEEIYKTNKYPNIALLLNSVNFTKKRYGHGYIQR